MLFPHIQSNNEQLSELFHGSDTTDIIQNVLNTSNDNSDFDDNTFDDEPFCNIEDDQSNIFDNEIYNLRMEMIIIDITLDQNLILIYYKRRSSFFQPLNNFPEIFDVPDTNAVYDSPWSFDNQSTSSLHFKQSQTCNRSTRNEFPLRLVPRKIYCNLIPSPSSPDKQLFSQT